MRFRPGQVIVGPSLAGAVADASAAIQRPGYKGEATDVAGYLHESIVNPGCLCAGRILDRRDAEKLRDLSAQEVDDLVAYLLTLK